MQYIYRPTWSAICEESYPPIGTSKFTGPLFIHVVALFSKTVFLHANIISYCSLVVSIYSLA